MAGFKPRNYASDVFESLEHAENCAMGAAFFAGQLIAEMERIERAASSCRCGLAGPCGCGDQCADIAWGALRDCYGQPVQAA